MNAYVPSERLRVLVDAFCTDAISRVELRELDMMLRNAPEARQFHAAYCRMHAELMFSLCAEQAVRSVQRVEPPAPSPTPVLGFLGTISRGMVGGFSESWPLAYLLGAVIFVAGLWVGSLFTVTHYTQMAHVPAGKHTVPQQTFTPVETPVTPTVGRVTGMYECQWEKDSRLKVQGSIVSKSPIPNPQSPISLGDKFALASGLLEITYDTGAKVILQGPVTYTVESASGGYLSVGKLTARLDSAKPQAADQKSSLSTLHSPLFTIKTPMAIVTDLGTEFGVEVNKEGVTTSHVFRGSVRVRINGQSETTARVLHENEAVRVEKNQSKQDDTLVLASTSPAKPTDFVRRMPSQVIKYLDMVDVVAGGDGFSGRRNGAIDPTNGSTTKKPPKNLMFTSDGQYHRVPSLPMIDGVFIPKGKLSRVQIDSAGHVFDDFGNTDDTTSDYVWAIGVLPSTPEFVPLRRVPYKVGDVNYGSVDHGALFLHANKGITFDLDAVRRAHHGATLRKFVASVGSTFAEGDGNGMPGDIRVFIDGKVQLQRRDVNVTSGAIPIAIPLRDNNRHLTLTATAGGRGIGAVWIVFGDPRIEMVCIDNPIPSKPPEKKGGSSDNK